MLAPWRWSLAVEAQCYLLLPPFLILLYFNSRRQGTCLLALILAAPLIRYVILLDQTELIAAPYITLATNEDFLESVYDNLHTRYDALLIGVFAAHLHINNRRLMQKLAQHAGISSAIVIASLAGIILLLALPLQQMHVRWDYVHIMLFHMLHRPLFA